MASNKIATKCDNISIREDVFASVLSLDSFMPRELSISASSFLFCTLKSDWYFCL